MATKKTTAKKETVNEVTITMTVELTSVVKLPTNDPEKAAKAAESEKNRIFKKLANLGVDNVNTQNEKTFVNLAE